MLEDRWQWESDEVLNWDVETSVRMAWVALQMDKDAALEFLHLEAQMCSGEYLRKLADQGPDLGSPLSTYRWMSNMLNAERFEANGRALTRIEEYLSAHLNTDDGAVKC